MESDWYARELCGNHDHSEYSDQRWFVGSNGHSYIGRWRFRSLWPGANIRRFLELDRTRRVHGDYPRNLNQQCSDGKSRNLCSAVYQQLWNTNDTELYHNHKWQWYG